MQDARFIPDSNFTGYALAVDDMRQDDHHKRRPHFCGAAQKQTNMTTLRAISQVFLLVAVAALALPAQARLPFENATLAPMLEQTMPAVVNISTKTRVQVQDNPLLRDPFFRRFFDVPNMPRERESQSLGSGVVVNARLGHVLTNHHVVDKADEILVTLQDGREFAAEIIGSDPESDVAVVKIDAKGLQGIPVGDSDQLRVGDFVVAIGNPFGLSHTVTSGIVSALGRSGLGIEGYEDFIQTDASINPGNSGGALVNLRGQLVGINTAIIGPNGGNVGVGFAIPINMARQISQQIIDFGEVKRGQLGVGIQTLTPELAGAMDLAMTRGVLITQVAEDTPAAKAGLRTGDIITAVDGKPVDSAAQLRNAVGLKRVGDAIVLQLVRDGRPMTVRTTLAARGSDEIKGSTLSGEFGELLGGLSLRSIEADHPLHGRVKGVLVSGVERGSPAARSGLLPGDIITSVNRTPVTSLEEFKKATASVRNGLLLHIRRGDGALFLHIR